MIRKFLLPLLAIAGVVFAIYVAITGAKPVPSSIPVAIPAETPFGSTVAGAGLVEANSQNIAIGTPVAGVVTELFVKVGSAVKAGAPLFKLDDRNLQAERRVRQAALTAAQEKLARLRMLPRAEDVPATQAKVREAEAILADARNQASMGEALVDKRAMSSEEVTRRRYAALSAEAKLAQSQADLALLQAGAWKPDLAIAEADVASAQAMLQATETDIDRLTVRSPIDGEVLQENVRLGEFAQAGVLATPLMLVGNIDPMFVRVDVDENDAWRVVPGAAARASLRGNKDIQVDLKFQYLEPFVVPKKSLTGDTTERVDTRVLQVLFSFERGDKPIYVGQHMDVFIDASSAPASPGAASRPASQPR